MPGCIWRKNPDRITGSEDVVSRTCVYVNRIRQMQ